MNRVVILLRAMVTSWVVVRCADIRNTSTNPRELLLSQRNWSLICAFEVAVRHRAQPASPSRTTSTCRVSVEGERLRCALEPEQGLRLVHAPDELRGVALSDLGQQPAIGDHRAVEVAQEQRARASVG